MTSDSNPLLQSTDFRSVPFADLATYLQERSLCAKGRHRRIGFVKIKNPIFVACQSL